MLYDLHLHSTYSDGDKDAADVVRQAHTRGVAGISLTDHNGTWGLTEAKQEASKLGVECIGGIEITALYQRADIHMLGYSQAFKTEVLEEGLASTRQGYAERIDQMVKRAHHAGYPAISLDDIYAHRAAQKNPCFVSYDVAKQLHAKHNLSVDEARRLTVKGGACYVPYGTWALHPIDVIRLVHAAGGVVVLAHPGTIVHEAGTAILDAVCKELIPAGLDGIEVFHPFHSDQLIHQLRGIVKEHHLFFTGGSDWHGPGRYHETDFGKVGLSGPQFAAFQKALD